MRMDTMLSTSTGVVLYMNPPACPGYRQYYIRKEYSTVGYTTMVRDRLVQGVYKAANGSQALEPSIILRQEM